MSIDVAWLQSHWIPKHYGLKSNCLNFPMLAKCREKPTWHANKVCADHLCHRPSEPTTSFGSGD